MFSTVACPRLVVCNKFRQSKVNKKIIGLLNGDDSVLTKETRYVMQKEIVTSISPVFEQFPARRAVYGTNKSRQNYNCSTEVRNSETK